MRRWQRRFGDRIVLISKCDTRVQEQPLHWLDHHNFETRTGVSDDRIRFCRKRHEKIGICETLGVTHFVDDRLEVLSHMDDVATRYLFQGKE